MADRIKVFVTDDLVNKGIVETHAWRVNANTIRFTVRGQFYDRTLSGLNTNWHLTKESAAKYAKNQLAVKKSRLLDDLARLEKAEAAIMTASLTI